MKRTTSNNLFTFAKAWPLVAKTSYGPPESVEITRSIFDMQNKIHSIFDETNKEIQVNFDILDRKLLQRVAKYGTRVLHLTSDKHKPDKLYIEGENGMCEAMDA